MSTEQVLTTILATMGVIALGWLITKFLDIHRRARVWRQLGRAGHASSMKDSERRYTP